MNENNELILTPVGRMVQGDPFVANTKDHEGRPLTDQQGQPRVNYFFAIAIPKTDPGFAELWAKMQAIALAGFPNGESQLPAFAWKVTDGDLPPHNTKEGFPGHYILKCSNGFEPKVYTAGGKDLITSENAGQLKRGYYVRAYISIKANGSSLKPGLYLNPSMVELVGYGPEIVSGPDGAAIFGGTPAALPAGASATPLAPTTVIASPAAMPGMNVIADPNAAIAQAQPAAMPGAVVQAQPIGLPAAGGVVQQPAVGGVVTPAPDFLNVPQ